MKKFLDKYKSRICLITAFVCIIHFSKICSAVIGIDTENLIKEQSEFYRGWLDLGRYGLVFIKFILGGYDKFNPYFAGIMTVVFLSAAIMAFLYLWDKVSGNTFKADGFKNSICWIVAALVWASHPVITEQMYFSLQSMEVCFAICLTAAALLCIYFWQTSDMNGGHRILPFISFGCLLLSFATYQSFVELFIFGTVTVMLLNGIKTILKHENDTKAGTLIRPVVPYLVMFFAAFAVNMLITKLCFGSSSYLSSQIEWGRAPTADVVISILKQIKKTFTGADSVHYDFTFGIITIITLVLLAAFVKVNAKGCGKCIPVLFFYFFSAVMTPYLLTAICGGNVAIRSRLALPALEAFYVYVDLNIIFMLLEKTKGRSRNLKTISVQTAAVIFSAVCVLNIWRQTTVTEALYYTEKMSYEQDVYIARELIQRIDEVRGNNWYPVVFIGTYSYQTSHASLIGETIGRSFFEQDADTEPRFYWSTRRALGLMHVLGYNYEQVTEPDMIAIAMERSKYMPEWPNEGCVQVHDDMIIVKMSNFDD